MKKNILLLFVITFLLQGFFSKANAQEDTITFIPISILDARPILPNQLGNTYFLVHYDNTIPLSYVNDILEYADYAYDRICNPNDLNWQSPIPDDRPSGDDRMDIYIIPNLPTGRGETVAEYPEGTTQEWSQLWVQKIQKHL